MSAQGPVRGGLSKRAEVAPWPHYSRTQPERAALGLVRLQRSGASDWLPRRPGSDARTLRTRPSRLAHHDLRDHLRHAQTSPRDSSDHASDDRPCARLRKARASRPPSRQQQHSPLASLIPASRAFGLESLQHSKSDASLPLTLSTRPSSSSFLSATLLSALPEDSSPPSPSSVARHLRGNLERATRQVLQQLLDHLSRPCYQLDDPSTAPHPTTPPD
jgi:hypothetical protein